MVLLSTFCVVALLVAPQVQPMDAQHDADSLIQGFNESRLDSLFDQEIYSEDSLERSRCHPMKIPLCADIPYNRTTLPNILGQHDEQDIIKETNMYSPLVRSNCSPDLKLFLCSVYAPICFDRGPKSEPIGVRPCRSLCESAREGCARHFAEFDQTWPEPLNCNKFPQYKPGEPCVGKEGENETPRSSGGSNPPRDLGFVCPRNFEVKSYTLHLNGKKYSNCALPCDDVLLDKPSSKIVRVISGLLALVCMLSTIFTCATFLVDTKKFEYPARPIIIIAFCQLVVSTCYFIGFITGNKISCNEPTDPPNSLPNMRMIHAITMGNRKGICTLQFMALYFFQTSIMFWWLMMTISWYMIAYLKWCPEAVGRMSRYFHLISWTIPGLLTIYLSVLGNIEGDPLTGTCNVSMSDQESIRTFVILPTLICLILGIFFLASGFKSLWDSREALRSEFGKQMDEHHKLIIRIGLYSSLFILFAIILLYCHYYEQANLNSWMFSWLSRMCEYREYSIPCPIRNFSNQTPHYSIFVAKYVATMATGIISVLFMLSDKTITSYRSVAELCNYKV